MSIDSPPTSIGARTDAGGWRGGKREARDTPRDPKALARLFESLPPHAIEAEMSLLGSILVEPSVLGDVILLLKRGEEFFKPAHGVIYDAMVSLYDHHATLDIVQLHQHLVDRTLIEAVGGLDYLVQLATAVPHAANAAHYARLVREKAMVRQLIAAAGEILYDAHNSSDDARTILSSAESKLFNLANAHEQGKVESLASLVNDEVKRYEALERGQLTGLATGFHDLDEITTGLQKAEMLILAARPSMGKTAMALNIAENMATRGSRVGFFSLEMSKQQLVQRLLCARAGIESQKFRRGMLNDHEFRALCVACGELQDAPIYVDDTPGLTLLQMRTKARRMVSTHGVQAIFIDYLQLLSSGKRAESRQVEVGEISRGVKAMARELNVPVICLSQLNRGPEDRTGNRPRMSDLRESGSIEQDADVVMLLHREDYYHKDDADWVADNPELVGVAELIISKQRNGPTGVVKLSWLSASTKFRDHSDARPPAGYGGGPPHNAHGARNAYGAGAAPPRIPTTAGGASASWEPKMAGGPSALHDGGGIEEEAPFDDGADSSSASTTLPSSAFAGRSKTGPVQNFRDGGGPTDADNDGGLDDVDEMDGLPI